MRLARMNRVIERIMKALNVDRPTAAIIAAVLTAMEEPPSKDDDDED
jgi:hypothetical protein